MHARDLVELAVIVSCQGRVLATGPSGPDVAGLGRYWTASHCRLDRWQRALHELSDETLEPVGRSERAAALVEEVILSNVLTATWTAVLAAWDRLRGTHECESLAKGIWVGHLETCNRATRLLLDGPHMEQASTIALDQLRRRAERWTDLLVGQVAAVVDVSQYAADPDRAREFADDLSRRHSSAASGEGWTLLLKSLAAAFRESLATPSPCAELNAKVASAILATIGPKACDATDLFPSLWMTRLLGATLDAEALINELFALDAPLAGAPFASSVSSPAKPLRRAPPPPPHR